MTCRRVKLHFEVLSYAIASRYEPDTAADALSGFF
jgi:hypothetical protein